MLYSALVAAFTLAPPSPVELEWNAPSTCPKVVRVRELVGELVPTERATATRLRAISTVEQVPGGFEGTLELSDGDWRTTRALFAEDCMLLARATAVVVAVSLDPIATVEELRVGPQDPPGEVGPMVPPARPSGRDDPLPSGRDDVPARPSGRDDASGRGDALPARPSGRDTRDTPARPSGRDTPARPSGRDTGRDTPARPSGRLELGSSSVLGSASVSAASARPSGRLELGARLGVGLGGLLLPAPGVGLSLSPFVGTPRLHVRANLQYWAPQRVALDAQRDASGELQLVTVGLRVCPQLQRDHLRLPLCAGIDGGAMFGRGQGRDLTASHTARQPWLGAVLQPGLVIDVTSRMSLWLALEGVLSLYRPRFAIEGASRDFTAGAGDVRGLLGMELHTHREKP